MAGWPARDCIANGWTPTTRQDNEMPAYCSIAGRENTCRRRGREYLAQGQEPTVRQSHCAIQAGRTAPACPPAGRHRASPAPYTPPRARLTGLPIVHREPRRRQAVASLPGSVTRPRIAPTRPSGRALGAKEDCFAIGLRHCEPLNSWTLGTHGASPTIFTRN